MKKGELWLVDLSDGKGHEQKGKRPALVLANSNGLILAAPLTSNLERAKFSFTLVLEPTKENGLNCNSVLLLFQLVSLDESRFKHKIGIVSKEQLDAVDELLARLFKIS